MLAGAILVLPVPVAAGDFPDPPNTEPSSTRPLSPAEAAAGLPRSRGVPGQRLRRRARRAEPGRDGLGHAAGGSGSPRTTPTPSSTQRFDLRLRDRVLIFEDTDGDGRFDRRTVFTDDVQRLGSVELGFGGVWLLCPPQLLFVPDRDGDDVPDGPAEVVLDGFTVAAGELSHLRQRPALGARRLALRPVRGLVAGPDRRPRARPTPRRVPDPRRPLALSTRPASGSRCSAHGTTNPWGHDWNALGEAFFINTVNGHLWHMIPGAHFARPHTIEPNPRAYALIDQHADH